MARADLRGPEFKDEKIEQAGPHCELAKAGRLPGKWNLKGKRFWRGNCTFLQELLRKSRKLGLLLPQDPLRQ